METRDEVPPPLDGRVVALDYGRRRVGVAASDPMRVLAQPRDAVPAGTPPTEPGARLLDVLDGLAPAMIVVGIPLHMDGSEGEMAREVREFARRLEHAVDVPVVLRDERLTSIEAERTIRRMNLPKRKREDRGLRDAMAAAVLLEDYLRETSE